MRFFLLADERNILPDYLWKEKEELTVNTHIQNTAKKFIPASSRLSVLERLDAIEDYLLGHPTPQDLINEEEETISNRDKERIAELTDELFEYKLKHLVDGLAQIITAWEKDGYMTFDLETIEDVERKILDMCDIYR